jgi:hypothetical protein
MDSDEKSKLMTEFLRQKQEHRMQLARLPIEEKVRIVERMREWARIARQNQATQPVTRHSTSLSQDAS